MIKFDAKNGREQLIKEVAKNSTKRLIKNKELYRFTLAISPSSFQTVTNEQKEELKKAIKKGVEKIKRESIEEGK